MHCHRGASAPITPPPNLLSVKSPNFLQLWPRLSTMILNLTRYIFFFSVVLRQIFKRKTLKLRMNTPCYPFSKSKSNLKNQTKIVQFGLFQSVDKSPARARVLQIYKKYGFYGHLSMPKDRSSTLGIFLLSQDAKPTGL